MPGSELTARIQPLVLLMAAALSLQQGSTSAAVVQHLQPELNSLSLIHGKIELPEEALTHLSHALTNSCHYEVNTRPTCFQLQLHTNQAKAEQKQCVQLADSATSVDYQLTLPTSDLAGPGKLTVALEHTPFQASTYLQLTGLATKADIQLSKHQSLHSKLATPASMLKRPAAHPESGLLLTVPSPLLYGSAIQLKAFMHGRVTDIPYYAVSEELLENILPSADFRKVLPLQTPYHGSLPANIGLEVADMLLCPATHSRSNEQHQQDGHWQLPAAPLRQASAPPALSGEQRTPFAWLPWGVSLCLLLCTIASLLKSRQQAARQAAAQHDTSAAQPAAEHEASFVKSNWPGLDPTPTKDTGSSPFVPVTHFQAPVPHWPLDNAHLASCSSKIGSYKQKARPATSKAVTNMTSNVSGATKWQRNKNGRLLSLALDPDEHNS